MNRLINGLVVQLACVGAIVFAPASARAAALADFGFNIRTVNNEPATNTRPLLIILTTNSSGVAVPPGRNASYYSQLFFSAPQKVMGFFEENSNGRFQWTTAGVVGPIQLTGAERNPVLGDDLYYSNIIAKVVTERWFDFQPRDLNEDGTVTADELQLVIINNEDTFSGGARGTKFLVSSNIPNGKVNVYMPGSEFLFMNYQTGFDGIAHELTHTLGCYEDLYLQQDTEGCLNAQVTILGCTGGRGLGLPALDNRNTFHLDPWNKMRLGWSEPRIVPLNLGGVVTLPAAYLRATNAPVILYDTNYGPTRFFMIEYRKPSGYDRDVLGEGMVLWHVVEDLNHSALQIPSAGARFGTESGWVPCKKCAGFFAVEGIAKHCAADGSGHDSAGGPYFLESDNAAVPGERGWRRCQKCEQLFYGVNQSQSVCSRDGLPHTPPAIDNRNYSLRTNDVRGALALWYRCFKCQSLYHTNLQAGSSFAATQTCPDGGTHTNVNTSGVSSRQYFMVAWDWAMFSMFPPGLQREAMNRLWSSGETTPELDWADGVATKSRIYIRPFSPGADEITVEIRSEELTWVDFAYLGPERGSFNAPYRTLANGVTHAAWGGILNFKGGSSSETALITKPLTMQAPQGTVIIGQ